MSEREGPVEKARRCWNEQEREMPKWVLAMAKECARTSQNKVAKTMKVSSAMISNVIAATYPNMTTAEAAFRGAFLRETVRCPALGELTLDRCRMWRAKSRRLVNSNARNVTMYRACNSCPVNRQREEDQSAKTPNADRQEKS